MRKPTFNIIYIPGTVAYQSVALLSLLYNSSYSFRLVGNSLCHQEAELLRKIADCSDRLQFVNFESNFIIPHGTLLDLLFQSETNSLFCFCDSDIFLFEALTKSPECLLGKNHVFSSAGRIENEEGAIYTGFKGGATRFDHGLTIPLATSFFCIYKRETLEFVFNNFQVGFEQYRNINQISIDAQEVIKKRSLNFSMFDTGKLISVLLHHHNKKVIYEDIDGLIHIGGMSGRYLQNLIINKPQIVEYEGGLEVKPGRYKQRSNSEILLKRLYGKYFYLFLNSLVGIGHKPKLAIKDIKIKENIIEIQKQIETVMTEAYNSEELKKIVWHIKQARLK